MGNKKGFTSDVCRLSFKYFIAFFVIVLAATYLGFLPKVKLADGLVATSYIGTIAFLMAVGGIFFWIGDTVPILGNYLGGACLLPLIGASFLNYIR